MSRVYQVINNIVHWQTPYNKLIDIGDNRYPPETMSQFIETDNELVREGWGYINGEFVPPTPPKGWVYDVITGTFYKEGTPPPENLTNEERLDNIEKSFNLISEAVEKGMML